ncbi:response regulator transcription factor [Vibrio sp. SCSIO 43140]|uniref:response regulator transcription factor n=1 Tax=Vibrio sp. SCSIO 43140 TaxID=2819100 RepID=UPI002075438D|nr:response regulator transcription factor [Vibrio sp. SCSIO 43140]USD61332.1 response regulator transcription factor [Vibrio sp. SCSIO 43140]
MSQSVKGQVVFLVVDDHPLVGEAIRQLVSSISLHFRVHLANTANEALKIFQQEEIDCLILDIQLEEGDGFDLYRRLKRKGYSGKTLFCSSITSTSFVETALKMGADGYFTKNMDTESFRRKILKVVNTGHKDHKAQLTESNKVVIKLSERETLVKHHLMAGLKNKEIAIIMNLSEKTISTYKHRILKKHDVKNIIELRELDANFNYN